MGCGYWVQGQIGDKGQWVTLCEGGCRLAELAGSSDVAEMAGLGLLVVCVVEVLVFGSVVFTPHCRVECESPYILSCRVAIEHLL